MLPENTPSGKSPDGFEFQKSLKERDPYPFLKFLRVERYFTRPLASLIVRAVFRTSISPNQLTVLSCFLGIVGGIAFLGGSHAYFMIGGAFFLLSSIVDCADGMLARSKEMCTKYGSLLDLFCDRIVDFFVFTGGAVGWLRYSGDRVIFILGLVGTGLYFLQVTLYYLMRHYQGKTNIGQAAESRGLAIFVLFLITILNRLDFATLLLATYGAISLISKIIRIIKWRNQTELSS